MRNPIVRSGRIVLVAILSLATGAAGADVPSTVTVSAGEHDRQRTPVSFAMPAAVAGTNYVLKDDAGGTTPLQTDGDRRGTFLLADLKAGQSKTYRIEPAPKQDGKPAAAAEKVGGAVKVTVGGKEVLSYQGEKTPLPEGFEPQYQRGGYIYPLYTPAGVLVTDDYPPKHKHHHGVWSPWTHTEFEGRKPDFWNMGLKTGTVEFVSLDKTWSGPVRAGFQAKHRFMDLTAQPQPKAALNEMWEVNVYNLGDRDAADGNAPYRLFDWQSTQTTATDSPLILPEYYYGGLGFRGRREWDGPGDVVQCLTSEGKDRSNGDEAPARWVRMTGKADGKDISIVILDHPDNFRFPQPARLHPKEPFVCFAPQHLGDFKIEPGKPYVAQYRFVTADGVVDKATIERLWNDYAKPVKVESK